MFAILSVCLLASAPPDWKTLEPGIDYRVIELEARPQYGDGKLHVVRIDPRRVTLVAKAVSSAREQPKSAREWCEQSHLKVAINAGMFNTDHQTHTGFFRLDRHVNASKAVAAYKSWLFFGPRDKKLAAAALVDSDVTSATDDPRYDTAVQNLRLIKAPGVSVWKENGRAWSEALIASDRSGHILFIFTRTPFTMFALNERLLASDLEIVRAMHLEGGPEASLSIHTGGVDLDLSGSFETGFVENDRNDAQWPIPNVIGVVPRGP